MSWAMAVWHKNQFILNSLRILFKLILLLRIRPCFLFSTTFISFKWWRKQIAKVQHSVQNKKMFIAVPAANIFSQWLNFNDIATIKIYFGEKANIKIDENTGRKWVSFEFFRGFTRRIRDIISIQRLRLMMEGGRSVYTA